MDGNGFDDVWVTRPQEAVFEAWLGAPKANFWQIRGEGGSGKSSLLGRFAARCGEQGLPSVIYDPSADIAAFGPSFLLHLRHLRVDHAPRFQAARDRLNETFNKLAAYTDLVLGNAAAWDQIQKAAMLAGDPTYGAMVGTVRDVVKLAVEFFKQKENADRRALMQRPEETLLQALAEDLRDGGVFLVDTWEKLGDPEISTRTRFTATGGLETLQVEQSATIQLVKWLEGWAHFLLAHGGVLFAVAGRTSPAGFGDSLVTRSTMKASTTQAFTWEEVASLLGQLLPEYGSPPESIAKSICKRLAGNPYLVHLLSKLIAESDWGDEGWNWALWHKMHGDFAADDTYGLVAYFITRLADRIGDDQRFWRLAVPHTLVVGMADALFPSGEGEPCGTALLDAYVAKGILGVTRAGGVRAYVLHDVTREALTAYARKQGRWLSPEAADIHCRLADYWDSQSGWDEDDLRVSEHFYAKLTKDTRPEDVHPAFVSAAWHLAMACAELDDRLKGSGGREQFAGRLARTVALSPRCRRAITKHMKGLDDEQLSQLTEVFRDAADALGDVDAEAEHFIGLCDISDPNSTALVDSGIDWRRVWQRNPGSAVLVECLLKLGMIPDQDKEAIVHAAWANGVRRTEVLGQMAQFMENVRGDMAAAERLYRAALAASPNQAFNFSNLAIFIQGHNGDMNEAERLYRAAEVADPRHANSLANFAVFMQSVRGDMDEAERLYRAAEAADPKHANNLGNFAVFMKNVRGDMDEAERLYRAAEATDPKHANNLGNFAVFMQTIRGDVDEAERLYRAAEAADPKRADILGAFAVFMQSVRGDMDEAERLYGAAEAADPKHANNLGNFALFMEIVRGDMDEVERLYRAAEAADPKHAKNLGAFAVFMQTVRGDVDEAERLYRAALDMDPDHANCNGNLALLLIATGREAEAGGYVDNALAHAGDDDYAPLRLECWLYRYAVFPEWREQALAEMKALLTAGVVSPGWDLSGVIGRAKELGHPEPERLDALAVAIVRPKDAPLPEGLFKD